MDVPMVLLLCANCGIPFAISEDLQGRLRKCHNIFYCPVGHHNVYNGESEEEKLRKQLRDKEISLEYYRKQEDERLAKAKKSLKSKKAKKTKK